MIKLGACYMVKLIKSDMPVRVESEKENGIWISRSLIHGRVVLIKDESQILRECSESDLVEYAKVAVPNRCPKKKKTVPPPQPLPIVETPVAAIQRQPIKRPPHVSEFGLTLVEAAYIILRGSKKPLTSQEIVDLAYKKKLHRSNGETPANTANAALLRIIKRDGDNSRFIRVGRGLFTAR